MNLASSLKNIRPENLALSLAILWLITITLLRLGLSGQAYKRDTIKVGYLPITCHLLLPVAMDRSPFFKANVTPVKFTSWPDMIESVKGGELDAALILAPIALSMMGQGVPVEIALLGHRNGTGLVVSSKGGIRDASDFRGKTVAIPIRFSTQNLALLTFLQKEKVDIRSVKRVELPPPDMPSALASGAIDGYIVGEPYATQARLMGAGTIFKYISSIWPNFISSILIVRKDRLKTKKAEIDALIRGLYEQGKWVEGHRRKAASIGARFFGLSPKLIKEVLLSNEVSYRDIVPVKKELDEIGEKMVKFGLIRRVPEIEIYRDWK